MLSQREKKSKSFLLLPSFPVGALPPEEDYPSMQLRKRRTAMEAALLLRMATPRFR